MVSDTIDSDRSLTAASNSSVKYVLETVLCSTVAGILGAMLMLLAESANALNVSEFIFPTLECIHIVGFATMVGSISILDFRLLGIGLVGHSPAEIHRSLTRWTWLGMALIFLSGLVMYASDPDMYYLNWSFLIKMACLALAITFHFTVRRSAVLYSPSPENPAIAFISLSLWASVVFGGIFIGFVSEGL